jgi:hypothetical protein
MTMEDALAALRARWGQRWQIWYVPLAAGGATWCARRHGDHVRNVIHADTPDHLSEYLTDSEQ